MNLDLQIRARRRGRHLIYATIAWNAFEGGAAILAGVLAHSVALTGFGLDSSVEVFVSVVAIWQLRGPTSARTAIALRLIGGSFLIVAVYVGIESVRHLLSTEHPHRSMMGIGLTVASVLVMVSLGLAKLRIGRQLGNQVLHAEATFSLVDAALAGTVLVGLALNATLQWWWADPAAALVVAMFAAKEGAEGLAHRPANADQFLEPPTRR